jgi:hypothetical protein
MAHASKPMSLRRCEWRVWFHEQSTSKPFIHNVPSYGLWNFSGNPIKLPMNGITVDEESMFTR